MHRNGTCVVQLSRTGILKTGSFPQQWISLKTSVGRHQISLIFHHTKAFLTFHWMNWIVRGLWIVPYIANCYLIRGDIIHNPLTRPSYSTNEYKKNIKIDIAFSLNMRKNVDLLVSNRFDFGHLQMPRFMWPSLVPKNKLHDLYLVCLLQLIINNHLRYIQPMWRSNS